ncbi:MAG: NUDIX domain-containing protein, partial [Candidatus Kariarchaeaceae archaeon]
MTKQQMISVYPIRYVSGRWEHLIIKRATVSYNWQCVTGGVERDESPLEAAHRELFEETAYRTKTLIPFTYDENFFIDDEPYGEHDDKLLEEFLKTIENIIYIAVIEEHQEPVLDPKEHTDWLWCNYQTAYEKILWAIEKKQFRLIFESIDRI